MFVRDRPVTFKKPLTIALIAAGLSVSGPGCTSPMKKFTEKPQVELQAIEIEEPSFTAATIVANLRVTNPNPVSVKLDEMKYTFSLNGKELASGVQDKDLRLNASGVSTIKIPLRFHYSDIFSSISQALRKGSTDYQLKGEMKASGHKVPFKYDGKINLPETADLMQEGQEGSS